MLKIRDTIRDLVLTIVIGVIIIMPPLFQTSVVADVVYQTDFSEGLPAGWFIVDGFSDRKTRTSENPGGRSNSNWTGTFMIVDIDRAGHVDMNEELISPSIDCSGYEQVALKYRHYFRYYSGVNWEIRDVDIKNPGIFAQHWLETDCSENPQFSVVNGERLAAKLFLIEATRILKSAKQVRVDY
jgi:hypothetical protein